MAAGRITRLRSHAAAMAEPGGFSALPEAIALRMTHGTVSPDNETKKG